MIQKHLINSDFLKDYISKDKIRKALKEIEENDYNCYDSCLVLRELLGEDYRMIFKSTRKATRDELEIKINELQKELKRQIKTREINEKFIEKNFISKQTIREEIKELENMKVDGEVFTTAVNFAKKVLNELLEE